MDTSDKIICCLLPCCASDFLQYVCGCLVLDIEEGTEADCEKQVRVTSKRELFALLVNDYCELYMY